MIRLRLHLAFITLALVAAPVSAAAQLTFHGLRWGAPATEVSERIRAAGYPLRGRDQWGDLVFSAPAGGSLVAWMSPAGLVGVELEWKNEPPGRLPTRFARLADSLQARYGPATNQHETLRAWLDREGAMALILETRLDSVLLLYHSSVDKSDEIYRRDSVMTATREQARATGADSVWAGAWQPATDDEWPDDYVDILHFTVLGPRMYGARMLKRVGFTERLENGLLYDAAVTEVELDCAAIRSRLLRTRPLYLELPTPPIAVPQSARRWVQPGPGSQEERTIRGACAQLARQPLPGAR